MGGKNGEYYIVTDSSDDDAVTPRPGTLRYAVIQTEPLWIMFPSNMPTKLSQELIFNSYKTLDGSGALELMFIFDDYLPEGMAKWAGPRGFSPYPHDVVWVQTLTASLKSPL
ncbi:hypothetical protein QYF36_000991 [Acer negundo]|nr:hypothetical protein QYF36_008193 [Acer negundo]KAK4840853.1 hypothetical protein QYF36_019800 [Acer negundo]KAK4847354.1 hypothetical protein QYF36_000991 [Acer negundo]